MARVNSKLRTILPLVRARLVTITGIVSEYVNLSLPGADEEWLLPLETDFVLDVRPLRFALDQAAFYGGGTTTPKFDGMLEVILWGRYGVDEAGRADLLLTDATFGILVKWDLVLKALLGFDPATGGNEQLVEPMRCLAWDTAPRRGKPGWAKITSTWECKWNQDVS